MDLRYGGNIFPMFAPLGTAAAPSYSLVGDTNTGMYSEGADFLAFSAAGAGQFGVASNSVRMRSAVLFGWTSGTVGGTVDTSLARRAVGVVASNSMLATSATTVTNLLAAATAGAGARHFVTDALTPVFGNAVTGGGAVAVPVYSDGTIWRVG